MPKLSRPRRKFPRHIFLPDTQVRPGVPTDHLEAAGNYIAEKRPDVVISALDHWDMPSLSSYETPGSAYFEGKRVAADIEAGNEGMERLLRPIAKARIRPRMIATLGNHEHRITRAINKDPKLDGILGYHLLNLRRWEVFPFLTPVDVDGILYCHYFVNPQSLKKNVLAGSIDNRLNKIKQSFTMGHQQTRMFGSQYTLQGKEIMGLVAGAFYQHDEDYMGPQGNHYWRGIVVKNEVHDGRYDPCFVSLDYLLRNYR